MQRAMDRSFLRLGAYRAPSIQKAELGALCTPKSDKADSSPEAEKIFKDLRPLEQRPALDVS